MEKNKKTKVTTYVEFFYPGLIFPESSVRKVKNRDVKKLKIPTTAFGFHFFDIKSTIVRKTKMESKRLNASPFYYFGGRIMTLEEVCKELPEAKILINNMECNGWDRVIRCRTGNYQPFVKGYSFIEPKQRDLQIVA